MESNKWIVRSTGGTSSCHRIQGGGFNLINRPMLYTRQGQLSGVVRVTGEWTMLSEAYNNFTVVVGSDTSWGGYWREPNNGLMFGYKGPDNGGPIGVVGPFVYQERDVKSFYIARGVCGVIGEGDPNYIAMQSVWSGTNVPTDCPMRFEVTVNYNEQTARLVVRRLADQALLTDLSARFDIMPAKLPTGPLAVVLTSAPHHGSNFAPHRPSAIARNLSVVFSENPPANLPPAPTPTPANRPRPTPLPSPSPSQAPAPLPTQPAPEDQQQQAANQQQQGPDQQQATSQQGPDQQAPAQAAEAGWFGWVTNWW